MLNLLSDLRPTSLIVLVLAPLATGCVQSVRASLKPTFDESARAGVEVSLTIAAGGEVGRGRSSKQALLGTAELGGGVTPERQGVLTMRTGADYSGRLGRDAGSIAIRGGPRFGVRTLTEGTPLESIRSAYVVGGNVAIAPISKALKRPRTAAAPAAPPGADYRPQVVFINAGAELDVSYVFDANRNGPREGALVGFGPYVEMMNFAPKGDESAPR